MRRRLSVAVMTALVAWTPLSMHTASAIFCYAGDPPAVYQACLSYNQGIGQQVNNEQQLQNIRGKIADLQGQINAIYALIASLNNQVAASDRKLLGELGLARAQFDQTNADLTIQKSQQSALLQQQLVTEADLEKNVATQKAAIVYAQQLEAQLQEQYVKVQQERAAIDAQVAQLQQKYDAEARAAGGGSGVVAWQEPACGFGCISQPFGCSTFYLEPYDSGCPYPHRIHTGVDIAAPYGSPIVAADTGVIYLYPGSIGYGNLIVMVHGNGYSTYYGHLASYAGGIQSGQIIARGDLIAYEGSTGWSTGPHLHFEVRVNGNWKNPCIWLGC